MYKSRKHKRRGKQLALLINSRSTVCGTEANNSFSVVIATICRLAGSATGELPGTESLTGQLSAIITLAVAGLDGTVVEGMIT